MDEHSARLVLLSSRSTAAELREGVGLKPDEAWERGERFGTAARYAGVSYRSSLPREFPVEDHLGSLLKRLESRAPAICSLALSTDCDARLWIGLHSGSAQWQEHAEGSLLRGLGFVIQPQQAQMISALGAKLVVDLYCYGDDDIDESPEGDG